MKYTANTYAKLSMESAESLYRELLTTDCGGFMVEEASAPRIISSQDSIVLDVKFSDLSTAVEFNASPYDTSFYGRVLYDVALAGVFGEVQDFRVPDDLEVTAV